MYNLRGLVLYSPFLLTIDVLQLVLMRPLHQIHFDDGSSEKLDKKIYITGQQCNNLNLNLKIKFCAKVPN